MSLSPCLAKWLIFWTIINHIFHNTVISYSFVNYHKFIFFSYYKFSFISIRKLKLNIHLSFHLSVIRWFFFIKFRFISGWYDTAVKSPKQTKHWHKNPGLLPESQGKHRFILCHLRDVIISSNKEWRSDTKQIMCIPRWPVTELRLGFTWLLWIRTPYFL